MNIVSTNTYYSNTKGRRECHPLMDVHSQSQTNTHETKYSTLLYRYNYLLVKKITKKEKEEKYGYCLEGIQVNLAEIVELVQSPSNLNSNSTPLLLSPVCR